MKARRRRAGRKEQIESFLNSGIARLGLLVITLSVGFLYVLQMNLTATKGYAIRELEQQITSLEKENRNLELEAMELQSVERLVEQLPSYYLVDAKPDRYVSTTTTTFAAR